MKRKLLIGLGVLTSLVTPVAVISCSCSSKSEMQTKVEEYEADRANYSYIENLGTLVIKLSERDSKKVLDIISKFNDERRQIVRNVVNSRSSIGSNNTFAGWLHQMFNRVEENTKNNILANSAIVNVRDDNGLLINIEFNVESATQPISGEIIYNKTKELVQNQSIDKEIEKAIAEDIREEVKQIWNIIKGAIIK